MLISLLLMVSFTIADPEPDPNAESQFIALGFVSGGFCANGGYCVPPSFCAPWYLDLLYDPAAPCLLAHGTPGVCCVVRKLPGNHDSNPFLCNYHLMFQIKNDLC